jgi:hypothetical protein
MTAPRLVAMKAGVKAAADRLQSCARLGAAKETTAVS